jgi:hypothetical protein
LARFGLLLTIISLTTTHFFDYRDKGNYLRFSGTLFAAFVVTTATGLGTFYKQSRAAVAAPPHSHSRLLERARRAHRFRLSVTWITVGILLELWPIGR